MIDIKAIRQAAEKAEKHFYNEHRQADFRRITDRKTVIALCDEVERLRKDAARYQWIRHGDNDEIVMKGDCRGVYLPRNERLDAAIDAAMQVDSIDANTIVSGFPSTSGEWLTEEQLQDLTSKATEAK